MASKARLQAFLEDFLQLRFQRVHVPNTRRAWRHPFCLLLLELEKIKVKAAVRDSFCATKCFPRNREQRKTWRHRQRLSCTREHHATPGSVRLVIQPSITPHGEEVERITRCFVPNRV